MAYRIVKGNGDEINVTASQRQLSEAEIPWKETSRGVSKVFPIVTLTLSRRDRPTVLEFETRSQRVHGNERQISPLVRNLFNLWGRANKIFENSIDIQHTKWSPFVY